jgi:endonuclease/exonuclease/phosphatase family metal-dependent hydrolase/uncharacterized protein (UPF0248 family)
VPFPTEQQVYNRLRWDARFDVRRCEVVIALRPEGTQRMSFGELDVNVVPWHRIVEFWVDGELAWSRPARIDRLDELARPRALVRAGERVRVATWNLGFDGEPARWLRALDELARCAADAIVLVEMTPPLLELVLAQAWARDYHHAAAGLVPHGQVVLAREPIRDVRGNGRVVYVQTDSLAIAAVHLVSNRTADAAAVRAEQRAAILAHVAAVPRDWVIAGDFNDELGLAGAVDAGETAGATLVGRTERYDRILVVGRWVPVTCERLGTAGEPASDHYGVVAELLRADVAGKQALVLLPPEAVWGPIQRVRCTADRSFGRWPPHVTLRYPYAGALPLAVEPFDVAFDRVGEIKPGVVALFPDRASERALAALGERLGIASFRPHLTIARDGTAPELAVRWRVERMTVLREIGGRFVVAPERAVQPFAAIVERVRAVAGGEVEPFGSSVYAPGHAGDLDLLLSRGDPAELARALGLQALPTTPPRLVGELAGQRVDLVIADDPRMRAGPRDAALLVEHLRLHGRHAAFLAAWPHVKRFVRLRALGHNGLGWFGSFGWAMVLAVPLAHDATLCAAPVGRVLAPWLRWLAALSIGARIGFGAVPPGDEPLFVAAPAAPLRDCARLSQHAARALLAEARRVAALVADGDDVATLARIPDLADDPPPGETLAIAGTGEDARGRYDGAARGLLHELGAARSWGRFERDGEHWVHRITVPAHRAPTARAIVEDWLARTYIDAALQ